MIETIYPLPYFLILPPADGMIHRFDMNDHPPEQ